jgi:hypothetical protein
VDGLMPVKFTANPPLIPGASIESSAAAQSRATRQLREESNGQGCGVLVWGPREV